MATYPSFASVVRWHDRLIYLDGGAYGVRDPGLLLSALAAPRMVATYGSRDPLEQAAALAYAVAKNHAFVDGNKRTAFACLDVFLWRRGLRVKFDLSWVDVIEGVADGSVSRGDLLQRLREAPRAGR